MLLICILYFKKVFKWKKQYLIMKREVELYFFAALLLGVVFLLAFFQTGFPGTGFAVFGENSTTGFNVDGMENVYYNNSLSAVVLNESQTSGTYTSQIFNAVNSSVWNNLTWAGSVSGNAFFVFQVTSCDIDDCSDANFSEVIPVGNLITLTSPSSRYFQYKIIFENNDSNDTLELESVSIDYDVLTQEGGNNIPTLIDQNVNTDENTGVELTLSGTDSDGDSLVFSIVDSPSNGELGNITQVDNVSASVTYTPNTEFSGDDSLTFKANDGTEDSDVATILITVVPEPSCSNDLSLCDETNCVDVGSGYWYDDVCNANEETIEEETTETTTETESEDVVFPIPKLDLDNVQSLILSPEDSESVSLVSRNTGTKDLSSCVLSFSGDSSEWISYPQDSFNLNQGEERTSSLAVSVPEDTSPGEYVIGASVGCFGLSSFQEPSTQITVNVIQKTFEFNLTDVRKIRDDEVRVTYVLTDLSESDQTIELRFALFDDTSQQVSEITDTQNLSANSTEERFRTIVPINETIEGNLTIQADINSQVYSSSVNEAIVLRAPSILGFVTLGQLGGTGGLIVLIVSILAIVAIIFISRRLRKARGITTK